MRLFSTVAVLALLVAPVSAQACSTLTATGNLNPGSTLTVALTGSTPDAFTLLFVGQQVGSTTINLGPFATFTLDLDTPFLPVPFGFTDTNGDKTFSVAVPVGATAPTFPSVTLQLQAVSFDVSPGIMGMPTLNTCVSNAASLTLP